MERSELLEVLRLYYQIRELIKKYSHVNQFVVVKDVIETEYKRLCDIEENYDEQTRSLNWLRDKMDCNDEGAYFNRDAFRNKTDAVCYIPANAEDLDDVFTYEQLRLEVKRWLRQPNTIEWLVDSEEIEDADFVTDMDGEPVIVCYPVAFVDKYLDILFSNIEWEFPNTFLNGLLED